jgi:hypothetical protein
MVKNFNDSLCFITPIRGWNADEDDAKRLSLVSKDESP